MFYGKSCDAVGYRGESSIIPDTPRMALLQDFAYPSITFNGPSNKAASITFDGSSIKAAMRSVAQDSGSRPRRISIQRNATRFLPLRDTGIDSNRSILAVLHRDLHNWARENGVGRDVQKRIFGSSRVCESDRALR